MKSFGIEISQNARNDRGVSQNWHSKMSCCASDWHSYKREIQARRPLPRLCAGARLICNHKEPSRLATLQSRQEGPDSIWFPG
jgi:hypothetical protein